MESTKISREVREVKVQTRAWLGSATWAKPGSLPIN